MNDKNSMPNTQKTVSKDMSTAVPESRLMPGNDAEYLGMLDQALDMGISIFSDDLKYKYLSAGMFEQLGLCSNALKVGDELQVAHNLMLENGILTPKIIEKNLLSADEHSRRTNGNKFSGVMEFADGRTMHLTRTKLRNGYTVSVSHDISELVEKDSLLQDAMFLGRSGYWIYDLQTKKVELSKTLQFYFPKQVKKAIKETGINGINAATIPEDKNIMPEAIKKALTTNDRFAYETRSKAVDGTILHGSTSGEIMRDAKGRPTKIRAFVKDNTLEKQQAKELKDAKDAAVAASHAKSEFLANMSHEIRTPMNGILGMAELLGHSDITERQRDFVKVINSSANALLTVINDILDFSKIEAGKLSLDPVPFDLKESINDVASLVVQSARDKGLELIVNYSPRFERYFVGDGGRLRQVVTNLLSNAIKFTSKGRIILDVDVKVSRQDIQLVTVSVADTGIGIEKDKLEAVFNKFTQADGSTTRLYGGTGLGLSISKCIVEMMHGRISVDSEFGKGTTFSFTVPLPVDSKSQPIHYDTVLMAGKRALIVDDVDVNLHLLSEHLRAWDMETAITKLPHQVHGLLKSAEAQGTPFDIILVDYLMPEMDGKMLAESLVKADDIHTPPMVMLSSCDQPMTREEFANIGIGGFMMKPLKEKRLHEIMVKVLSEQAARKKIEENTKAQNEAPGISPELLDAIALAEEPTASKPKTKMEILVAEDFDLNQDVVRLMLSDSMFVPVFANNGDIAVNMFKAEPDRFPLILMDVSMPVKDGYQATRDIIQFETETGRKHTPIIALTGHALKDDRDKCINCGMDDYLTKPVKHEDLEATLHKWLSKIGAKQKVA